MSIPFFFEPLRIEGLPDDADAWARWNRHAGLYREQTSDGRPPDRALFVDGGILSNFPINAFHAPQRVPRMPTFGVKLEYDNRVDIGRPYRGDDGFSGLSAYTGMLLNSARHQLDYEFVRRNPDYKHLVQYIPCVREHPDGSAEPIDWIDFDLPDEDKELLFRQGAEKAIDFVRGFSSPVDADGRPVVEPGPGGFSSRWAFYKELRRRLAQVVQPGA
jgi:NTE family protein